MKIKLIKIIFLSFCLSIFSCDSKNNEPLLNQGIKPDFFIELNHVHDMVGGIDNSLYALELATEFSDNGAQSNPIYIKKISKNGTVIIINEMLPFRSFTTTDDGGITIAPEGTPVCVSDNSNIIYHFNQTLEELYETEVTSLVPDDIAKFDIIEAYNNDSFLVYDSNAAVLRSFDYDIKTSSFELGNPGNKIIQDGVGSEVSFSDVSKILVNNDIIYIVDNYRFVRKITNTTEGYKVETIANTNQLGRITDFTLDKTNDEFVVSINQETGFTGRAGLYTLNIDGGDTFNLLAESTISLDLTELDSDFDFSGVKEFGLGFWGQIDHIYIDGNDIYFEQFDFIIKISDFRNKL